MARLLPILLLLLSGILQLSGGELLQWRRLLVCRRLRVRNVEVLVLWRWDELLIVVEVGLRIILPLHLGLEVLLLELRTLGRHAGLRLLLLVRKRGILLRQLRVAVLVLRILAIAGLLVAVVERRHPMRHVLSPVSYRSRLAFASGHIHRLPCPLHLHLYLTLDMSAPRTRCPQPHCCECLWRKPRPKPKLS